MTILAVNEIFGPTVQGEGPSLGRRAIFLRLAGCNLKCTWCDTKYTWDWKGEFGKAYDSKEEIKPMPVLNVVRQLSQLWEPLLVITGGEPLLQQKALRELIDYVPDDVETEIETNGTIYPDWPADLNVTFNVSPKLAHSGNPVDKTITPALQLFADDERARFKFVVQSVADLGEVRWLCDQFGINPERVWIMPEAITPAAVISGLRMLGEEAVKRNFNLTTRLHVLTWGNRRGV